MINQWRPAKEKAQHSPDHCLHCKSPLPGGLGRFCCAGCKAVYSVLAERGWMDYYQIKRIDSPAPTPVNPGKACFDFLDTSSYRNTHVTQSNAGWETTWYLRGLHCAACLWLVEKVVRATPKITDMELRLGDGRLLLRFESGCQLKGLAETLHRMGYTAGLSMGNVAERRPELLNLGLAGALAANLMLMSLPHYGGLQSGPHATLFGWIALLLATTLLVFPGRIFFIRAWVNLRHGQVDLNLPIAIGLLSAMGLSSFNLMIGNYSALYFDSMGMLVFFLLVGRYFQASGIHRALMETNRLQAAIPQMVQVFRKGQWQREWVESIETGDRLRLAGGEVLPVDAVTVDGPSTWNLSVVSGEAKPKLRNAGQAMSAGSVNLGQDVILKATSGYGSSHFANLASLATHLKGEKSGTEHPLPALVFTLVVTGFAGLGFWLWLPTSLGQAFVVAGTIFIVACPCALALSVPTARAWALRIAAQRGVWIKSLEVFDRLNRISQVVFDIIKLICFVNLSG